MRSLLSRVGLLGLSLVAVLGLLAPSVSAQGSYPVTTPSPVPADASAGPAVEDAVLLAHIALVQKCNVVDASTASSTVSPGASSIALSAEMIACAETITVQSNPVLFSGAVPKSGVINVDIPPCMTRLTMTAKLKTGGTHVESWPLTQAAGSCGGSNGVKLAFTGSSVNVPLALGAAMIGTGGLALLFARKREEEI